MTTKGDFMNNTKKILIGGVLASVLSVTLMTQTDGGFFSNLFGGSSSSAGGSSSSVDFKTMLSHVPADTTYMLANKEAIPEDVMNAYMSRSQDMLKIFAKMQYKTAKTGKKPEDKALAFYMALMSEWSDKAVNGKYEDTGFSLKSKYILYGYKLMPVMRISITDKAKVMESLKRAEDESGYKLKLDKCGEYECFKNEVEGGPKLAVVLLKDQLVASVFSKETSTDVMNHLIGKADPKESYSEDRWKKFLKDNKYKGYGDGFINLKKIYNLNKDTLVADILKDNGMPEEEMKACVGVIDDHVNNMPGIIFGITDLDAASMGYEMVFQTSESVSSVLQEIANKTNIAKRSVDPIFSMGLNPNTKKLGEALTTYSNFLIKSGETHKCQSVVATDIRKGMGGILVSMNMGLKQLKSIYVSLNDLKLDETMKPKKLDVFLSIGSDDPAGLLAMAAMMSPNLAKIKVPADGTAITLPAGVIPSGGMPIPPISISRSDKAINFMIGNDKPDLKDYKGTKPEIMSFALDGKRYYEIIGDFLKVVPQSKATGEDTKELAEMMTSMGGMMGKIQQEVSADKRGLVLDNHIKY